MIGCRNSFSYLTPPPAVAPGVPPPTASKVTAEATIVLLMLIEFGMVMLSVEGVTIVSTFNSPFNMALLLIWILPEDAAIMGERNLFTAP